MDCPSCGAGGQGGNYCSACGDRLPEPEVAADTAEVEAEASAAYAHASETYAEAELERATHATDEDVEVVEALADAETEVAQSEVAVAAIDAVADVAVAAIDAVAGEHHEEPEPEAEELEEVGAGELQQHELEHEALAPSQPDDHEDETEHVEPITLLAPAATSGGTRTTSRRSTSWRRHRR